MKDTINEEEFDGYYVVECPNCGKGKSYFKKDEKFIHCPLCNKILDKSNIFKTIKKKCNGYKNRNSSIVAEETSYFNY